MKNYINRTLLVLAVAFSIGLQSCKKDDDPSAVDKAKSLITARSWKVSKVTVSGTDQTDTYKNVILTIKPDNTFAATNGGGIFPSTGTWTFKDSTGKFVTMSLGSSKTPTDVELLTLTANEMTGKFNWSETTFGQGRSHSLEGEHVFTFIPN